MIKKFITWLYVKYVVMPHLQQQIINGEWGQQDVVVEFTPDPEFDAKVSTKH